MKIALIGQGNTGSEIEALIKNSTQKTHELVSVSSKHTGLDINGIKKADVVIEFTSPGAVLDNIRAVLALKKNLVIGTSGWYDHLPEVEGWVKEAGTGLIYGQNFSIGTNIFFRLVAKVAQMASKFEGYDVYGLEVHHKAKKDSPSGTALKIAKEVMDNFPTKKRLETGRLDRQIEPKEMHFASVRGGRNPGMHQVVFDSEGDQITLEVESHNRKTYAKGAIMAAEFIKDKTGFYSFDELFK